MNSCVSLLLTLILSVYLVFRRHDFLFQSQWHERRRRHTVCVVNVTLYIILQIVLSFCLLPVFILWVRVSFKRKATILYIFLSLSILFFVRKDNTTEDTLVTTTNSSTKKGFQVCSSFCAYFLSFFNEWSKKRWEMQVNITCEKVKGEMERLSDEVHFVFFNLLLFTSFISGFSCIFFVSKAFLWYKVFLDNNEKEQWQLSCRPVHLTNRLLTVHVFHLVVFATTTSALITFTSTTYFTEPWMTQVLWRCLIPSGMFFHMRSVQ